MRSPSIQTVAAAMPATATPGPDFAPDDAAMAAAIAMEPVMIDPLAEPERFARVASAAVVAAAREIGDFSAERLSAQAERIRSWSAARTPAEWLSGEMAFAVRSFASYAHEVAHLQEVFLEAAGSAAGKRT